MSFFPRVRTPVISADLYGWIGRVGPTRPDYDSFLVAIDTFVAALKASGPSYSPATPSIWTQLSCVYLLMPAMVGQALQNLKGPSFPLTAYGVVNLAPGNGISTDGSTGYLDLAVPPASIPGVAANSHTMLVYSQTDQAGITGEIGANGGGTNLSLSIKSSVNGFKIWSNTATATVIASKSGLGLKGFVRTDANGGFAVTQTSTTNFLAAAGALPSGPVRIFRIGTSGTYSPATLSMAFLGDVLTPAQTADLSNACDAVMTAFNTYIQPTIQPAVTPPHCFTNTTIQTVTPATRFASTPGTFRILRNSIPPPNDTDTGVTDFSGFPATDVMVRPWGFTTTQTKLGVHEFMWCDRGLGPSPGVFGPPGNPNDTMGVITNTVGSQCRTEFDSDAKAIGSTLVKMMYSAGYTQRSDVTGLAVAQALVNLGWLSSLPGGFGWLDAADVFGYDTSPWAAYLNSTTSMTTDVAINTDGNGSGILHRAWAAARFVTSATVALDDNSNPLGGSGGTNGAQVVTGTTGTGTPFQASVTVAGGTITAVTSIAVQGLYTLPPSNVAAEPVTGAGLTGACLALKLGSNADTFFPNPAHNGSFRVSNNRVILGQGRLCDQAVKSGFMLDFEENDLRSKYFAPDGKTDLLVATVLLLCAAAHTKGFIVGALNDPITGAGANLSVTPQNVGTLMGPNGLDFFNICTSLTPPNGDQIAYLQAQYQIFQDAGISPSKMCLSLFVGGAGAEMALPLVQQARTFAMVNNYGWSYVANDYGGPGGALSRGYNQVLATFYGLPTS